MWSLLKPMVGLDPKEVNFFKQPLIQARLQPLLGTHYDKAVQLLETADKIQQEGPLFYLVSTYTPVPELAEKAGFVWNSETNQMAVLMISGGAPQIFAEKLNEQVAAQVPVWPKELADYTDPAKLKQKALEQAKAQAAAQLPVPAAVQPIAEAALQGNSLKQQGKALLEVQKEQAVSQLLEPVTQTKQQLKEQILAPVEQTQQQLKQQILAPVEQTQQQLEQQILAPVEQTQQQLKQQIMAPVEQTQQQLRQQIVSPVQETPQPASPNLIPAKTQTPPPQNPPAKASPPQQERVQLPENAAALVKTATTAVEALSETALQPSLPTATADDEFAEEQAFIKQQQRDLLLNELQNIEQQLQKAVSVDEHFTLSQRKLKLQQQLQELQN